MTDQLQGDRHDGAEGAPRDGRARFEPIRLSGPGLTASAWGSTAMPTSRATLSVVVNDRTSTTTTTSASPATAAAPAPAASDVWV